MMLELKWTEYLWPSCVYGLQCKILLKCYFRLCYPTMILKNLVSKLDDGQKLNVFYDIACRFADHLRVSLCFINHAQPTCTWSIVSL